MSNQLQFKISSALKNIIGRDLINDDFIAVFELVKNSYDAHASVVDIYFENIYTENAKIIIQDNGKGMSYDDLINKWLFVAYSAKKEGTEEDSYDYRNNIKVKRAYAGAKGIGRFSCDRLGANLYLETKKDEPNSKTETLFTEWENFDGNIKDEFINISVLHETISHKSFEYPHGTRLEISNLHNEWDRKKILKLKDALAKLINPNNDVNDAFQICINAKEEIINDLKEDEYRNKVNGNINNLIFETLDLKTTKITSVVTENEILTELLEGGKSIYRINEKNNLNLLCEIDFTIYFLNRSAKYSFSKKMGVQPVDYGHIFMYKNGLRIYPYGERGEDPLKMDNRKAQGNRRNLGTREVIGYIEIKGENPELSETSSRGDGLKKTSTYNELYEWFYITLRRLEKYIIEVSDWGKDLSEDDYINLNEQDKMLALRKIVEKLSKSKDTNYIDYSPNLFQILNTKQENSARNVLSEIKQKIKQENFDKDEILKGIEKAENKISILEKIKEEAEDEALGEFIKNEGITNELESEKKKGSWQGALIGTDKERILGLQHQIFHSSGRINRNIKLLLKHLESSGLDDITKKHLSVMSLEAAKINSIANFVTKANFNLRASEIERDLVEFIEGYINEIYIVDDRIIDSNLIFKILNKQSKKFVKKIRPLDITTLFDNLISNSEKAGAKNIIISFENKGEKLVVKFSDDSSNTIHFDNINKIFDLGFTTTNGSGIGLFQVKDIINKINGTIEVKSEKSEGTTFTITL